MLEYDWIEQSNQQQCMVMVTIWRCHLTLSRDNAQSTDSLITQKLREHLPKWNYGNSVDPTLSKFPDLSLYGTAIVAIRQVGKFWQGGNQ